MSGSKLLFILTGSIAGYKACDAISRLVQRGHRVRAVLTGSARHFVGEATLEGLTGERVATDLFAPGAALEHIELVRWADAIVVCPATANTLNRFAAGLADDLPGALLLAHDWKKPCLIAPAMNPAMWQHPATVASVAKLTSWGATFIAAGMGRTACGEIGVGRLAEPEEIVTAIEAALGGVPTANSGRRLRVLVTSGATSEPIDGVRVLTNTSSGRTGAGIAAHFARHGHEVVLLRARDSAAPTSGGSIREEAFFSFADLEAALTRLLSAESFDVVIHAAAVSDFGVEAVVADGVEHPPGAAKLDSSMPPVIRLRRHPKLVGRLHALSRNLALMVIALMLTVGADATEVQAAVKSLLERASADLVVHNDLAARDQSGRFPATLYGPGFTVVAQCPDRGEIGAALERYLQREPAASAAAR
jgi:phosphopantothenoylcysteine decarboxylase/phosphopantothenate--cysteine ligase